MPWNAYGPRTKTELNPQVKDLWESIRQMQNVLGGLSATVSTIALQLSRSDARLEHVSNDLHGSVGRLEDMVATLAVITNVHGHPEVKP